MSEGSSGQASDQQSPDAAAASSHLLSGLLGPEWVEVEPGIYRQIGHRASVQPSASELAVTPGNAVAGA